MFPYKNPITFSQSSLTDSVNRNVVYGNTFSILNIGGYMEVWGLNELELTLTSTTYPSQIQLSANTIPINFTKGTGSSFSPDSISLNSDNISSGRRRLGMLVFVQETGKVYQFTIDNYEELWNNMSGLTGNSAVTQSDYSTIVNSRSQAGRDFIDAWTGSTIEGVSGVTRENARWRIFSVEDIQNYGPDRVLTSDGTSTGIEAHSGITISGDSIFVEGDVTTTDLHFNENNINVNTSNNVNNWYFTGNFFSVAGQETNPQGVFFKTDGTKMYVNGTTTDRVFAYDLSTPWDITTSVYNGENYFLGTYDASPTDLYISNDGLNFYSVGSSSDRVVQYTLGTPWNVSTATFVQFISTALFENAATGIYFKPDGTIMYIVGTQYDTVFSFSLSTPWDISTAVLTTSSPLTSDVNFATPQSIDFSDDGTRMFVVGSTQDVVGEWYLPTPWDVSVIEFVNISFKTSTYNSSPTGIFYSDSIQKAYIIGASSDTVRSFDTNGGININSDSTYIGGQTIVEGDFEARGNTNLNKSLAVFGQSIMYSTLTAASTLTTNSSTRLADYNGGEVRILNGVKSNNNAYLDVMSNGTAWGTNTTLNLDGIQDYSRNINLLRPEYGTKTYLNIGYRNVIVDLSGRTNHSGVIIIDSDAQEFNHTGSVNIGKVLQVENGFDFEQLDISGTTIFLDTFTEAVTTTLTAHTPDIGSGWDLEWTTSGVITMNVIGGLGYAQSSGFYSNNGIMYLSQDIPTSADYEVKVTFSRQASGDDVSWIILRYQDSDNYYALRWSASYNYCILLKKIAGVWSSITPSTFNYGVDANTTSGVITTLTLRMIGNTLTVFNNDMYRGSWEDNDILTTGKFGFGVGRGDGYNTTDDLSNTWYFDEFSVKEFDISTFTGTTESYINGKLGVGTKTIDNSAILDVSSTSKGFLPPRMTTTQRDDISSPAEGLIVYCTDGVEGLYNYTNGNWEKLEYASESGYKVIASNYIDSAPLSGTTSITTIETYVIPANTFQVGDRILFRCRLIKTGTLGVVSHRHVIGNWGVFAQSSAANTYSQIERLAVIKAPTNTEEISVSTNVFNSTGQYNFSATNNTDWTIDQNLTININNQSTLDSTVVSYWELIRIRD